MTRPDPIRTVFFTYIPRGLKFLKIFRTPMKKFLGPLLHIQNYEIALVVKCFLLHPRLNRLKSQKLTKRNKLFCINGNLHLRDSILFNNELTATRALRRDK
ncbi:hypothetical protein HanIR_Chr11g0505181 [Helianthus annuus]|nr:hypothetical protein HanIR_Chr11g0505181 [Helianthus annuus]